MAMDDFYLIPATSGAMTQDKLTLHKLTFGEYTPYTSDEANAVSTSLFPYSSTGRCFDISNAHFLYVPSESTAIGLVNDKFKPLSRFGVSRRPIVDTIIRPLVKYGRHFEGPVGDIIEGYDKYIAINKQRESRRSNLDSIFQQIKEFK